MDGQFLNKMLDSKTRQSMVNIISDWKKEISVSDDSWEANDLHVDEISERLKDRVLWIHGGLYCFQLLLSINSFIKLIPFLHIALSDTIEKKEILKLSEKNIFNELDDYTPPSLMYIEINYLLNTIASQLSECLIEDNFSAAHNHCFYFRTWYDPKNSIFSREIYVFEKKINEIAKHR